jgi:hypothetical protein
MEKKYSGYTRILGVFITSGFFTAIFMLVAGLSNLLNPQHGYWEAVAGFWVMNVSIGFILDRHKYGSYRHVKEQTQK